MTAAERLLCNLISGRGLMAPPSQGWLDELASRRAALLAEAGGDPFKAWCMLREAGKKRGTSQREGTDPFPGDADDAM